MSDLIERYIHQVVRNLPPHERAEIAAELRSSIQDQLDDRFGGAPSQEEITAVLLEFGSPRELAESYQSERYLVGPDLYPYLMMGLGRVWLIVPAIVIFLSIFGALTSPDTIAFPGWLLDTLLGAVQATLIISAIVVLSFAIFERLVQENDEFAQEIRESVEDFDPRNLPEVNDPAAPDRFEAIFGVIFGLIVTLALLYFVQVGGLTLRFNLSDPGEVIPVPRFWLILLIFDGMGQILVHLWVLRNNRWNIFTWLSQTVLELIGVFCLYFILYLPLANQVAIANPALGLPVEQIAQGIAVLSALPILIGRGSRFIRLWNDSATAYPGEAAI